MSDASGTAGSLAGVLAAHARAIAELVARECGEWSEKPDGAPERALWDTLRRELAPARLEGQAASLADPVAQLTTYALLAARWSARADPRPFTRARALAAVPRVGGLLDAVLAYARARSQGAVAREITGLVARLERAPLVAIERAAGPGEGSDARRRGDPLIRFYERFLAAYAPARRRRHAVFYTPPALVRRIVSGVHDLLIGELELEHGLASTRSRASVLGRDEGAGAGEDDAFVRVLDPAMGTGAFLYELIVFVERALKRRWCDELRTDDWRAPGVLARWRTYVARGLLPRLHGLEIMASACAIARLRLTMLLRETGFELDAPARLRLRTADSLALVRGGEGGRAEGWPRGVSVVIGNPPYANFDRGGRTDSPSLRALLDDYKRGLRERKLNLDDDYIKFMRAAQAHVEGNGAGALGLVTNNSYLTGLTHRRMRASLRASFDRIDVINLHGDVKKRERGPDGARDENVFAIQQGVAITLAARRAGASERSAVVRCWDVRGPRERKLRALAQAPDPARADTLTPRAPHYFFTRRELAHQGQYEGFFGLKDIFEVSGNGVKTERDRVSIHFTPAEARRAVDAFRTREDAELRDMFSLGRDSRDWSIARARADVRAHGSESLYRELLYRPFDLRHTWYSGQARGFVGTPAWPTMRHMVAGNVALVTTRQTVDPFGALCTDALVGHKSVARYDINSAFPLYRVDDQGRRIPNVRRAYLDALARALGEAAAPEDVFGYIYAILHSPGYRRRYAGLLALDFPRVPTPRTRALWSALARIGRELCALHRLAARGRGPGGGPRYVGREGEPARVDVVKRDVDSGMVWIDRARTRGFGPIDATLWETHVGGYQVCRRWLLDRTSRRGRPGRVLSVVDRARYAGIVAALATTRERTEVLDETIARHGGWPAAFLA